MISKNINRFPYKTKHNTSCDINFSVSTLFEPERSLIQYRLKFGCSTILSDPPDNVKSRIHKAPF